MQTILRMKWAVFTSVAIAGWAGATAAELPDDPASGAATDAAAAQDNHPSVSRPIFREPGPVRTAVLYHDGSVIPVQTEYRWKPVCGSTPNISQDDFLKMIEPARQALRAREGAPEPPQEGGGLNVTFSHGSLPTGAPEALEAVAQYIESTFVDNTSFTVTFSFQNLGGGGVLGFTSSFYVVGASYSSVRAGLQNGMDGDDTIQDWLPTGFSCPVRYSTSCTPTNETSLDVTVANYRATVGAVGGTAASITLNSAINWDYDPGNGVPFTAYDFQSIVAHEVGHAMGFTSYVDLQTAGMEMLDLYRFERAGGPCGDLNPANISEFQTFPRLVNFNIPSGQHIVDIGTTDYRVEDGDPWQASHFLEGSFALMDPTFGAGQTYFPNFMKTPDLTMFDAIGWDYPACTLPCSDGNVCTVNETCVGSTCVGSPVDCSTAGDDCNDASCDPAGSEGNCAILTATNEGGPCQGGIGFCQNGVCVPDPGDTRVFMAAPGQEGLAPTAGPTTLNMAQGGTATVEVWVADTDPDLLGGYQISLPASPTPQGGATGTITYVDNPDPVSGGDSVFIDVDDPDWAFAPGTSVVPFYSETGLPVGFAFLASLPFGTGVSIDGLAYLGEFQISASGDALGTFTLDFIPDGQPPNGGSGLANETGIGQVYATYQPLEINVQIGQPCGDAADCGDLDGNGVIDDACMWYSCDGGLCAAPIPRIFADAGGAFGACPVDGFANIHDANHALSCFSGVNTCDSLNIDVGGAFGACPPDGFCNIHDANHALSAFAGTNTCACPLGAAPESGPMIVAQASIRAVPRQRSAHPGDEVSVDLFLADALKDLRGYQLNVAVDGGRRGQLELADIRIEDRPDHVFAGSSNSFSAVNTGNGRMLSGLQGAGVPVAAGGYLATYTYRVSPQAAGTFVVDVLTERETYLIASDDGMIDVHSVTPAVIVVAPSRAGSTR